MAFLVSGYYLHASAASLSGGETCAKNGGRYSISLRYHGPCDVAVLPPHATMCATGEGWFLWRGAKPFGVWRGGNDTGRCLTVLAQPHRRLAGYFETIEFSRVCASVGTKLEKWLR